MKNRFVLLLCLLVLCSIFAGCSSSSRKSTDDGFENTLKPAANENRTVVKILYLNKGEFDTGYGLFTLKAKHPNLDFQVVSTESMNSASIDRETMYQKIIKEEKPDIIQNLYFEQYAAEGKLVNMEPYLEKDPEYAKRFIPGYLDAIRTLGGGTLYGISTYMIGNALIYNKDLFTQYSVPFPHNQMSWEEIINLAQSFSPAITGNKMVSGLFDPESNKSTIINHLIKLGNLTGTPDVDPLTMKVTLNAAPFKNLFNQFKSNINSGVLYNPASLTNGNPFLNGNSAMYYAPFNFFSELNKVPFDWDIVTSPVDPKRPNLTPFKRIEPTSIFSINVLSSVQQQAFEVIQTINNEARMMFTFPTQIEPFKELAKGHSVEAYFKLKYENMFTDTKIIPESYLNYLFLPDSTNIVDLMLVGTLSTDIGFERLQVLGQQALDKVVSEQKK